MMDNVALVNSLYDAFKRGDVETIFAALDSNIDWFSNADPALIPWGGERKGVAGAKEYFKELADHVKFESVTPREIIGAPNFVTVLGHSTGSLTPSGGRFDNEWAHMFRIRDGKVIEFREYLNTHALVQAYFGGDIHSITVAPSEQTARLHH